jgi:hypothetical protein
MSTIHYLHDAEYQWGFQTSSVPGQDDQTCVHIIKLDSAEPVSSDILQVEHARLVYRTVMENGGVKGPANQALNVQPIKVKLDTAHRNGIKAPKMLVEGFCFTRAKDSSKNPGCIYVKAGKDWEATYYGKITPEGAFLPSNDCTQKVRDNLAAITVDIVEAAKAYGRKTGHCSFCSRTLTHGVSIALSYGPVCAENYGMPHDYDDRSVIEKDVA